MNLDFNNILPYAVALLFAIPIITMFRTFTNDFLELKRKEIHILSGAKNEIHFQAYERIVLFLERIKPSNLVTNFDKNLQPHEFLFLTEKSIQEEYNYNTSLQLYISSSSWNGVLNVKNEIIKLLHTTYQELGNNANLEEYKTILLMKYINNEDSVAKMIEEIRKEFLILSLNK